MATDGINGTAVMVVLVGSVLAYSGLKGKTISNVARSLLQGEDPSDVAPSLQIAGTEIVGNAIDQPGLVTQGALAGGSRGAVMQYAEAQLGKPYVWAATGPNSFDCSGLTMMAYKQIGINLPHFSGAQALMGKATNTPQVGDIVWFGAPVHHVALWAGNNTILEAYDKRYPIKLSPMRTTERHGIRNIIGS